MQLCKVIGIGFSDNQERDLTRGDHIYRHLAELREILRKVTGSDPIMAKAPLSTCCARACTGACTRLATRVSHDVAASRSPEQ